MSLSYLINQSSNFIWYSAHYIISFKYATPIKIDKSNPPPFYGKMPTGRKLFFEMMKLLNEERKLINSKFYKIPKTELKDLINTAKGSFDFFLDLPKIDKRRTSGKFSEVKTNKDLPKYFLRNFHYQTDGYLSEKSARLYEFQVETLFSGCAATMRRFSMIPLIKFIKDENLPRTKLLDIGTGTGDIIATYKLNTKNLEVTCSDLSEEYLKYLFCHLVL